MPVTGPLIGTRRAGLDGGVLDSSDAPEAEDGAEEECGAGDGHVEAQAGDEVLLAGDEGPAGGDADLAGGIEGSRGGPSALGGGGFHDRGGGGRHGEGHPEADGEEGDDEDDIGAVGAGRGEREQAGRADEEAGQHGEAWARAGHDDA
jgi:hypothetical protein